MPIKQAAKKALRQAKKHALQNAIVRSGYRDAVKMVRKAATEGKNLTELLQAAQQKLDKAAKRGVIKSQTAGRKLSRLIASTRKSIQK